MNSAGQVMAEWREVIAGRPEQKEAITSEAALTVVSAGAGTGKTHTLAQRFAWLLASDKELDSGSILVLTFTEKAAREMQERIKATVTKWRDKFPKELAHLEKSIKFMDDACISTIHSFAMKMIRESALTLDIDPTASIIPAPKEDLWWAQYSGALGTSSLAAIARHLDSEWLRRAEELFAEEVFHDFVSEYSPNALAEAAKKASEILDSAGKTPEDLWNQNEDNIMEDIKSLTGFPLMVWDIWIKNVLPEITPQMRSNPGLFQRLFEILDEYSRLESNEQNRADFCDLLFSEGIAKLPGRSNVKETISGALGEALKEWRDRESRNLAKMKPPSAAEKAAASLLNRTCALGWHCWDTMRSREGMLSMNDLIRYAGEILAKTPAFGKKFRHILVDEFQDTDRLQDKMLSALWKEGENTLFIVGDLKQSIYRFRHADLLIFQEYIEKARCGGSDIYKYVTLDRSYRTKGALLSCFNDIFSGLWAGGLEKGTSMRYEPIGGPEDEAWWEERNAPELTPPFEVYLSEVGGSQQNEPPPEPGEKDNITEARLRLLRELGGRLSEIFHKREKTWDKSGDAPSFRPVKWSDFAVLVPSRGFYALVERAFGEMGIPYALCTSKNYFSRGEVSDIVNLVSLLAEPGNPQYLAGWLASSFCGATPAEAETCIEEAWRQKEPRKALPLAEVVRDKLPKVSENLERLRKLAMLRGVSSTILDLMSKPGFLSFYEPRQRRSVVANLTRLSSISEEYERSEGLSMTAFADYLKLITLSDGQKEEPDVVDEEEDAVRVMTIHASKGLEYPIVAVLCGRGNKGNASRMFISPRYGAGLTTIPGFLNGDGGKTDTVTYLWYRDLESERESAEKERLHYVALTRARDKLILCAAGKLGKEGKNNAADCFGPFTKTVLETVYGGEKIEQKYVERSEQAVIKRRIIEPREQKGLRLELCETSPAALSRLSASAFAMLSWCPTAYRIAYRQGRNMRWMVKNDEEQGGSDFGSLAHWILARWNFEADRLGEWLPRTGTEAYEKARRALPVYLRGTFGGEAARCRLAEMLSIYAASDNGRKMARLAARNVLSREMPFRVPDDGLSLVGSVDVLWEDSEAIHIRDWKTAAEETAPDEYYEGQLMFYAYSVWRFRKRAGSSDKRITVALNYLRPHSENCEAMELSGKKLIDIGVQIHSAAELALSGEFSKQRGRCERCPWRNDCN